MARVLLLLPTTTYRATDFLAAAARLKIEVVAASEKPSAMERRNPEALVTLDFRNPAASAEAALEFHRKHPIDAVVPVDDDTAVVAATIGEALSLKHNSVESAHAARNKHVLSSLLQKGGVPTPPCRLFSLSADPLAVAAATSYPCVLKPLFLSGSRGVIRADSPAGFASAWQRIAKILDSRELKVRGGEAAGRLLVQSFIPGREFALEGLLTAGKLRVLALFDKPDPLDGPFFEETIYVTPSRLAEGEQRTIADCVSRGAQAIGLREGPVHAELRLNEQGPWLIELAARSIGGLCSRTLRFGTGHSLEELILRHALGLDIEDLSREGSAAGVMMIPIPRSGVLAEVRGIEAARRVPGVEEVTITARLGNPIQALPEGSSYLGFIFARAERPPEVEQSLRLAHRRIEITIE